MNYIKYGLNKRFEICNLLLTTINTKHNCLFFFGSIQMKMIDLNFHEVFRLVDKKAVINGTHGEQINQIKCGVREG